MRLVLRPLLLLFVLGHALLGACMSDGVPAPTVADLGSSTNDLVIHRVPLTCDETRAALKDRCGFSESWIAGLSCAPNPSCVRACIETVKDCQEVGCAFCETCDCAAVLTPFVACVQGCQK